ncbi:hypothetical protein [Candidatus Magnetomonas plexicatena]|uniref:hypothetical protein n=1 Tax=Candidatus Magnetomonas plexicatena TaxID=2552947 RepID=UPI001104D77F|nr:hypothetical protein E2O03_010745 [Nitrospirales bacterium LBB_01]
MKIKTKLQIGAIISLIVVIFIGLTLNYERQQDEQISNATKTAEKLVKEVYEMNILVYDYMLKQAETRKRIYTQWQLKTDSLSRLLTELQSKYPKQQQILNDVSDNLKGINKLFLEISKTHDKQTEADSKSSLELERHLILQVLTRSQTIVSLSSQFYDISYKELSILHSKAHMMIIITVIGLTLFIIVILRLINQGIAKPIRELTSGMEVIGKGNLDYKLYMYSGSQI